MTLSPHEIKQTLNVLQRIADDPALIDDHDRFKSLIAKIYKQGKKQHKLKKRYEKRVKTQALVETTAIVQAQLKHRSLAEKYTALSQTIFRILPQAKTCYICQQSYNHLHFFYHSLCPSCAEFNYQKRFQKTDLTGRTALVTGGRIKVGYQTALRLLRDGAKVIITTRFPGDAAQRFSRESDFEVWKNRLLIHGLDLRNLPTVESFIEDLIQTEPALDILINNAAQTIKRPLAFYQHLLIQEEKINQSLSDSVNSLILQKNSTPVLLEAQPNYQNLVQDFSHSNLDFPLNIFDQDGQQLDRRFINSWKLKLGEISLIEMLEVQLANVVAPFLLNSKLKPLLMRSSFSHRFIINVSAKEGLFNTLSKTVCHPHTNMAKAALNMMTRTSAADYAEDGIYMNSVDPGWISDQNPYPQQIHIRKQGGFYTPLDAIDSMARIYDPIVQGIQNPDQPIWGQFLKDYQPSTW
ncbi:MAG: SDR family NAD(P)-dependent oxidoreductase [Cyanobacteria bacterium J06592_8]